MTTPLWDDETLHARYVEAFGKNPDVHQWALLCWLRDDLRAHIGRQEELLRQVLDIDVPALEKANDELRQQLAGAS